MTHDEAVAILTRLLRDLPAETLRRMAGLPTPTVATVASAILATRDDAQPLRHSIFSS